MPEERAVTTTDQGENRLDRLEKGLHQISERLSRLEGGFEQMSQRMGNVEELVRQLAASQQANHRWIVGLILMSWMTLVGLILKGQ